jgi:putative transposase
VKQEPLKEGHYYHIYNRGNDGRVLFPEPVNYEHFLGLYDIYVNPVAETFAWALMGNHFHLLVRIKKNVVYRYEMGNRSGSSISEEDNYKKWQTVDASSDDALVKKKKPVPHRHFGHLFNAYSRYHQNRYGRTGNLFERPFKRKLIHHENYFKQVVLYIHQNPVHHGFCSHPLEYPWTSYITCTTAEQTWLKREAVKQLFGDDEKFEKAHKKLIDKEAMDSWLNIGEADYYTESPVDMHQKN